MSTVSGTFLLAPLGSASNAAYLQARHTGPELISGTVRQHCQHRKIFTHSTLCVCVCVSFFTAESRRAERHNRFSLSYRLPLCRRFPPFQRHPVAILYCIRWNIATVVVIIVMARFLAKKKRSPDSAFWRRISRTNDSETWDSAFVEFGSGCDAASWTRGNPHSVKPFAQ